MKCLVKDITEKENPCLYDMISQFLNQTKNKELTHKEKGIMQVLESNIPNDIYKEYKMHLINSTQTETDDLEEFFLGMSIALSWML